MIELITEILRLLREVFDFSLSGKVIKRTVDIYDSMTVIISETDARRMAIFRAHNGGGKLKPDSPIYVSCIHEVYRPPFFTYKEDYQNLPIDPEFLRILKDVDVAGWLNFIPNELPNSQLKEIYAREEVNYVEIFKLKATRNFFYFCFISTDLKKNNLLDPAHRALIKLEINKIKQSIR